MTIPEYKGVPDTQAIRDDLVNYACDDCPWNLIDEALNEIDRLRTAIKESVNAYDEWQEAIDYVEQTGNGNEILSMKHQAFWKVAWPKLRATVGNNE